MRAVDDEPAGIAAPGTAAEPDQIGHGSSPLTALEGTDALLDLDRNEVGTPLGDLEAVSPR